MNKNWDKSFELVIAHEGGFTADERDRGNQLPDGRKGSTMLGVTQANWERYIGRQVTHDEMKKLTKADVKPFYKQGYWDAMSCDRLPSGVDYACYDYAVNAGVFACRKMIQYALAVGVDGVWGQQTWGAIEKTDPATLIKNFAQVKRSWYRGLKQFPIYGKGWIRRVDESEKSALGMIDG